MNRRTYADARRRVVIDLQADASAHAKQAQRYRHAATPEANGVEYQRVANAARAAASEENAATLRRLAEQIDALDPDQHPEETRRGD